VSRVRLTRRERGLRTRRKILGLVGVALIVWIVVAYEIPLTTYGSWLGTRKVTIDGVYALHIPGLPPVKYSANIDYSVAGDFSVGTANPIYMKAMVFDANRSDFGTLFEAIDLLFQTVQFGSGGVAALPRFHQGGPGNWTAEGKIVFDHQINFTGPALVPTTVPKNVSLTVIDSAIISQVKAYNYSFPQLQPQSYTDTLSKNESELRYGAMGLAIILLLLIPVLDRILLPEKSREDPVNETRQGRSHGLRPYGRRDSKNPLPD
jgi:hypothetical protein